MEFLKTNSTIIKKDSSLNFKQALLKKFSKKSHKSLLHEKGKPLKSNEKKETKRNNEKSKKQIKPFLTKREIQMNNNNKKTSEKIKNLLKHARNNNLKNNNQKNNFKNKSTSNLGCSPRSIVIKNEKNFEENKTPKINDFIFENNGMNHNINNINVVNVHNSTINICKNKVNIITSKSDENLNNIEAKDNSNFNINKNSSISSVVKNNKKLYLYSSSQSPSYRVPYNKELFNKEHYYLNNSNDNIESQNIYIKQKFNCPNINKNNNHIKTNTKKDFFKFEQNKSQNTISEKCLQNLLKTEPNNFSHINKFYTRNNMNKMIPIENINAYEIDYINNENNKNASNISNNNNISQQKNFFTANHYYYNLNHKRSSFNEISNISSPKIYVKPSNYPLAKNNISEKILNLSPSKFPIHEPPSPIRNYYFSNVENKTPIISSYRNNKNYNKRKSNYFHNIEFKSNTNTNTNEKLNKNVRLYDIQKSKTKAYIKKNKDIKFNKRNSTKFSLIKNKVSNNVNSKVTKHYNYFISRQLIIKRPFYCSKYIKKLKILPVNKRCFATKIVKICKEKIINNNKICNIDKIENKNNNLNFENKNNSNVIKANILDFSFEPNKEIIKDNKKQYFYHTDKEQSLGDLHLSFSTEEINTFKYKESTIEDVFNELNNLNSMNNDSEIKLTFGHENAQNYNYHNNYNISTTGGRVLNDATFHKYNLMNAK